MSFNEYDNEKVIIERVWNKSWIPRSAYVYYHRTDRPLTVMDSIPSFRVPVELDMQVDPPVVRYEVERSFVNDFTVDREDFFEIPFEKLH